MPVLHQRERKVLRKKGQQRRQRTQSPAAGAFALLLGLLAPAVTEAQPAASSRSARRPTNAKQLLTTAQPRLSQLPNGLRLIQLKVPAAARAQLLIAVGKGSLPRSKAEREQEQAWLATTRRAHLALRRKGGRLSLWRRGTVTGLRIDVAEDDVAAALAVLAKALRKQATNAATPHPAGAAESMPDRRGPDATLERYLLRSAQLGSGPSAEMVGGALTLRQRHAPDNLLLAYAGTKALPADVIAQLFAGLQGASPKRPPQPPAATQSSARHNSVRHASTQLPRLGYGWLMNAKKPTERAAQRLLQLLLASPHPGSAWHQLVRRETRAAHVNVRLTPAPNGQLLWLSVALPRGSEPFAPVSAINAHVLRLARSGPRAAELAAAKQRLATDAARLADDPATRLADVVSGSFAFASPAERRAYERALKRIGATEIQKLAARWLTPQRANTVELRALRRAKPKAPAVDAAESSDAETGAEPPASGAVGEAGQ